MSLPLDYANKAVSAFRSDYVFDYHIIAAQTEVF